PPSRLEHSDAVQRTPEDLCPHRIADDLGECGERVPQLGFIVLFGEASVDGLTEHHLIHCGVFIGEVEIGMRNRLNRLSAPPSFECRPAQASELDESVESTCKHDLGLSAREVSIEHRLRIPDRISQMARRHRGPTVSFSSTSGGSEDGAPALFLATSFFRYALLGHSVLSC